MHLKIYELGYGTTRNLGLYEPLDSANWLIDFFLLEVVIWFFKILKTTILVNSLYKFWDAFFFICYGTDLLSSINFELFLWFEKQSVACLFL